MLCYSFSSVGMRYSISFETEIIEQMQLATSKKLIKLKPLKTRSIASVFNPTLSYCAGRLPSLV